MKKRLNCDRSSFRAAGFQPAHSSTRSSLRLEAGGTITPVLDILSKSLRAVICFAVVIFANSVLHAQSPSWTLRTSDFKSQSVSSVTLDASKLTYPSIDGTSATCALGRFLDLHHDSASLKPATGMILKLRDGQQFVGVPQSIEGQMLHWSNPTLGVLHLPMSLASEYGRASSTPPATTPSEDQIQLNNGDSVHGIIAALTGTSVNLQPTSGEAIEVPMTSIKHIAFAATGDVPPPAPAGFRISLAEGSIVDAKACTLDNSSANLTLADDSQHSVPLSSILDIEQTRGPICWLSSLSPEQIIQRPFLGSEWPTLMDRQVDGSPLRFGQTLFRHGIGVHSYSRINYAIPVGFTTLFTRYAMADGLPLANVTVRIYLDERVAYEAKDVRSGAMSDLISLPLDSAKKLALEVDYGQGQDVQDRFNWIEPALGK